jgi:serine phosphatase RsbU (regulator of sigma subunit)
LLLPKADVNIPGIKIAFKFKAYKQAGGDYLDLFELPASPGVLRWGGIIADVTGHGPSAAVEAAMVDAILRTFKGDSLTTPADAANYLNHHFFTRQDRGKFVTAKLFSYSSDTCILRFVSAGHPNGLVKRGNKIFVLDESEGIPIGVLPDYVWEYHEFKMQSGDILFVYTDVVLETRNIKGLEFGEDRLIEALKNAPHCPHQLVDFVENELIEFSGGVNLKDDLTLSAILLE